MSCPAHDLAKSRKMLVEEDVDLIRSLVACWPISKSIFVVDLGSGSGTSALSVFAERSKNVHILGIDNREDELNWASEAVKNVGRTSSWDPHVGNVMDVIPTNPIDLLLLDVQGNTEEILRAWLPHMAAEGLVWVHDYGDPKEFGLPGERQFAVKTGIDILVREGALVERSVSGLSWSGGVPTETPSFAEKEPEPIKKERKRRRKRGG